VTGANGEKTVMTVRIWNETVSNLTLMALGSSAPEILLSVIEVRTQRQNKPATCIAQWFITRKRRASFFVFFLIIK